MELEKRIKYRKVMQPHRGNVTSISENETSDNAYITASQLESALIAFKRHQKQAPNPVKNHTKVLKKIRKEYNNEKN